MDYDSDSSDIYAEYTDEIIKELKEDSMLRSVCLFKEYISREPEFSSINNISSYEILNMFLNPKKTKSRNSLYKHQIDAFQDLTNSIFNEIYSDEYYNRVAEQIISRVCV